MTIDELIELATEAREDLGGEAQVRIAYQPGYPLRAALSCVTIPYSTDRPNCTAPTSRPLGSSTTARSCGSQQATSPTGRTPTPPAGPGSAPTSPQKNNGDKQHRKAPGLQPWTAAGSHARPSACTTTMAGRRRSTPYCRYSGGMTSSSQAIADTSKSPLPGGLAFSGQPGGIYARTSAAYILIKQKFDKTPKAAHFNHAMLLRLYDIAGIMHGT